MHFTIRHLTTYRYSSAVSLGPQILRLTPRTDGGQRLLWHECIITPSPSLQSRGLDAEGNIVTQLWFTGEASGLCIESTSRVETLRDNPCDYILDNTSTVLPLQYSQRDASLLSVYLDPGMSTPAVKRLALHLARETGHNTLAFLAALNDELHKNFTREIRTDGPPQAPERTLQSGHGACRDFAVLFVAVCRVQGIAARFVSGYQARAETSRKERHLHAWPEVYIPGGGWRGYDPGHGSHVADAHVAVAASAEAAGAAPIEGSFYGNRATSRISFELDITTA